MKDVRLIPYMRKLDHSYSFGVFPTIELLENKKDLVIKVLLHSRGKQNSGVQKIIAMCQKSGIRTEINDGLIKKVGGLENSYAVGVFQKFDDKVKDGNNHLVLVNPEDGGNLGTIIRTAVGFGIEDIAIIRPGVDRFDPKTVRASMGSVFSARIEYFEDFESYKKAHGNNCYIFMTSASDELSKTNFQKPFALVFGSESAGLPEEYRDFGKTVNIAQSSKIDSLNLSIAAGIAMYKTSI